MSGNYRKLARNKPHGRAHSSSGGISNMVKIATDIEEAARALLNIKRRARRERREVKLKRKRKITMPEFNCLKD